MQTVTLGAGPMVARGGNLSCLKREAWEWRSELSRAWPHCNNHSTQCFSAPALPPDLKRPSQTPLRFTAHLSCRFGVRIVQVEKVWKRGENNIKVKSSPVTTEILPEICCNWTTEDLVLCQKRIPKLTFSAKKPFLGTGWHLPPSHLSTPAGADRTTAKAQSTGLCFLPL